MIVDTNVHLSHWPCRRLPHDDTAAMVAHLQAGGITSAWAANFDALLHRDIGAVNRRTADQCRKHGRGILRPVGCINPALPDWQRDVRECVEDLGMTVIRLYPNYHGYRLDDLRVGELVSLADEDSLIVQIAVRMEDVRTQHPLLAVEDVDLAPLPELAAAHPKVPFQLLNSLRTLRGPLLGECVRLENVWLEIAMLEGIAGISRFIETFPYERLLFGSHAPFFLLHAALLKLDESELGATIRTAIEHENAARLTTSPTE